MDSQITCNGGADGDGAVRCTQWFDNMTREEQKLKLRKTIDELNNSSDECLMACSDLRVMELEEVCAELKNALAEANDYDSAAEGENSANFRHKRKEFDELATRAGRMLSNIRIA